eukprot:CAMPEP_0175984774 /NCGR_PEP_ID=MMETSP0108-20121206/49190_1 /TAXON_ID=195067 ORGANISM="Goniomonas pacifica, Strain CCMP1869" /NCGR_SAMPLE_ID=MMETSP0108 /ASSEMBLY_ACC=CAM_ASM_000204 /LENGTH=140 /DNA_ID=CAMNT_0017315677 /DNA_START=70 /DNA_END=493 /DNA_ORIENTATION=+
MGMRRTWERRYIVLTGGMCLMYRSNQDISRRTHLTSRSTSQIPLPLSTACVCGVKVALTKCVSGQGSNATCGDARGRGAGVVAQGVWVHPDSWGVFDVGVVQETETEHVEWVAAMRRAVDLANATTETAVDTAEARLACI